MAVRSIFIPAPPSAVWDVFADGQRYDRWVVGATNIRGVEPAWPQPGSRIHHTVGVRPFRIDDTTSVVAAEKDRALVLRARAWPAGEGEVTFALSPEGNGTRVTMTEGPVAGPGRWVHNPVFELLLHARNAETLRRLRKRVVERAGAGSGRA
jgi:uncharacterized protein YndB with AHSA1/START domain